MYWWNIDRLAEELKTGTLPEEENMKYFLHYRGYLPGATRSEPY